MIGVYTTPYFAPFGGTESGNRYRPSRVCNITSLQAAAVTPDRVTMDSARLLPWLAWTLLAYACVEVATQQSRRSPRVATAAAAEDEQPGPLAKSALRYDHVDDTIYQEAKGPQVLMVMDPNGVICWEDVAIDDFTNATLLHWLHNQHDALTMSTEDITGTILQASSRPFNLINCACRSSTLLCYSPVKDPAIDSSTTLVQTWSCTFI